MSDSHTFFASDETVGSENAEQSGLPILQPQLFQNRFAEGIGEFLVARDGGREAIAGIEINILFGPGSFEHAAECLKRVNKGPAFHAVRAISLVLARRRAAGRCSLIDRKSVV